MAECDLTPIIVDDDLQGTYDLLKSYFLRGNNPYNLVADYYSDDGFSIDFIRSYSFVASTYRANIHMGGIPQEDGTTKVTLHARSVDDPANLEKDVRDRIDETLRHMVAQKKNRPIEDAEDDEKTKKSNKIELIVVALVVIIIVVGTLPISCSDQFSRFWVF